MTSTNRRVCAASVALVLFAWADPIASSGLAGTWRLDQAHSELSGGLRDNRAAAEQTMTVEVAGDVVTAKTVTNVGPPARRLVTERFEVDRKPHQFTPLDRLGSGPATGTRTARWLAGTTGFDAIESVTREMSGRSVTVENIHHWQLSADGNTLSIDSMTNGPQGKIHTLRVLTRGKV